MRIKGIHLRTFVAALFALAAALPSTLHAEMSSADRAMARERAEIRAQRQHKSLAAADLMRVKHH